MDTFDLLDILVKNSTFSRGKLVSLFKEYPLDKFTTKKLLEEILSEKGGKDFTDAEDFVSYHHVFLKHVKVEFLNFYHQKNNKHFLSRAPPQ